MVDLVDEVRRKREFSGLPESRETMFLEVASLVGRFACRWQVASLVGVWQYDKFRGVEW